MTYDVTGIGNALVDLEVQVPDTFIESIGVVKGGMTLSTPEDQKKVLDAVADHSRKVSSGGSAANTVHGVGALGGKGYYLGRVADDTYGKHYTEDMSLCGVGFPGPDAQQDGTGTCVILVTPDSERTMLTHLGISSQLDSDNVDPTIVQNSKCVYIEGYLWTGEGTRAAAGKMADVAQQAKVPVALTLSDAFVVNAFKADLSDFIRWKVDILFCNEVEAMAMADTDSPEAAFEQLKGMADTVFMTRGKEGAWAINAKGEQAKVSAFEVKAVDTTGAGDLFAAGVLYGLTHDHSLKDACILGSYCASQVVSRMGARMPDQKSTSFDSIINLYPGS